MYGWAQEFVDKRVLRKLSRKMGFTHDGLVVSNMPEEQWEKLAPGSAAVGPNDDNEDAEEDDAEADNTDDEEEEAEEEEEEDSAEEEGEGEEEDASEEEEGEALGQVRAREPHPGMRTTSQSLFRLIFVTASDRDFRFPDRDFMVYLFGFISGW